MAFPLRHPEESLEPDISHLVTEDDTPVDSVFSEKQMRLLTRSLYASWKPGRDFLVLANVGLFAKAENPAIVPDVMVSLDVKLPPDIMEKGSRSYMVWRYGKPPDLTIEVVSNKVGGELEKGDTYARIGVSYYVIYDPEGWLGDRPLRAFVRHGPSYVDLLDCSWMEAVGVGLTLWEGSFEGWHSIWLRWCDREGKPLLTGEEQAEVERARADRLLARLRELGLDE